MATALGAGRAHVGVRETCCGSVVGHLPPMVGVPGGTVSFHTVRLAEAEFPAGSVAFTVTEYCPSGSSVSVIAGAMTVAEGVNPMFVYAEDHE